MHADFTRRIRWLIPVVALVLGGAPALAQQPQPLVDDHGEVIEAAYDYLSRPLAAADLKYESIRGARLTELMNEVVAFSRLSRDAGDRQWGRMAGQPLRGDDRRLVGGDLRRAGNGEHPPPVLRSAAAVEHRSTGSSRPPAATGD